MAHRCDWCHFETAELECLVDDYTEQMAKLDAASDALGGNLLCKPEDADRVGDMTARAASLEDDRAYMRICLKSRE